MRILARHFLSRYLRLFVAILGTSVLAISVIEVLLNFEEIFDHFHGASGLAHYLALRIPSYYLRDLLPLTSFAAAFFCFGLAARAHEVTAIRTGGLSTRRVAMPLLLTAAGLSLATLLVNETLVLYTAREWTRIENPGEEITFRRGSFWYHRGNVIYNVREADRESGTLRGVSVFETSPEGRLLRSTRAELVQVREGRSWHFPEATARIFDPERPGAPPRIEHLRDATFEVADARDLALLDARARHLSLPDLREYVRVQQAEARDVTRYRGILHERLADPLAVLVFALLATPLGLSVERTRSIATAAVVGIALLGVFYAARTSAALFAAGGVAAAAFAPWIVLGAFAAIGAWRFARE